MLTEIYIEALLVDKELADLREAAFLCVCLRSKRDYNCIVGVGHEIFKIYDFDSCIAIRG